MCSKREPVLRLLTVDCCCTFDLIQSSSQVLAAMREAAREDAETAQQQLEELQANAPDRIQEAYRRGAYYLD
jgi:hypothetical protein